MKFHHALLIDFSKGDLFKANIAINLISVSANILKLYLYTSISDKYLYEIGISMTTQLKWTN